MEEKLVENAIKTLSQLHKLLLLWLAVCVFCLFLPDAGTRPVVTLPFTTVLIPGDKLRWIGTVAIFLSGSIGHMLMTHLVKICSSIKSPQQRKVIYTYPSVATIGSDKTRWWLFVFSGYVQYQVGFDIAVGLFGANGGSWGVALFVSAPTAFLGYFEMANRSSPHQTSIQKTVSSTQDYADSARIRAAQAPAASILIYPPPAKQHASQTHPRTANTVTQSLYRNYGESLYPAWAGALAAFRKLLQERPNSRALGTAPFGEVRSASDCYQREGMPWIRLKGAVTCMHKPGQARRQRQGWGHGRPTSSSPRGG